MSRRSSLAGVPHTPITDEENQAIADEEAEIVAGHIIVAKRDSSPCVRHAAHPSMGAALTHHSPHRARSLSQEQDCTAPFDGHVRQRSGRSSLGALNSPCTAPEPPLVVSRPRSDRSALDVAEVTLAEDGSVRGKEEAPCGTEEDQQQADGDDSQIPNEPMTPSGKVYSRVVEAEVVAGQRSSPPSSWSTPSGAPALAVQRSSGAAAIASTYEVQQSFGAARVALDLSRRRGGGLTLLQRLGRRRRGQGAPAHDFEAPQVEDPLDDPDHTHDDRGVKYGVNAASRDGGGGGVGDYDSYMFEEDESGVHFEARASVTSGRQVQLVVVSMATVVAIGVALGVIAALITIVEGYIFLFKDRAIVRAMWPCGGDAGDAADEAQETTAVKMLRRAGACSDSSPEGAHVFGAYMAMLSMNCALVLAAALLTYWAPRAAMSGLPPLKAFLNGVRVPRLLNWPTLVAKTVGITMVVSTGLPLGREGPMVHAGAIVAARFSRLKLPITRHLYELRLPSAQRNWVGMGAAAGVAAAFNAPLGGILYSFEEVCSHWSTRLTWRSFFCTITAAVTVNLLLNAALSGTEDGRIIKGSFVIGYDAVNNGVQYSTFGWYAAIGVLGGALGALYNTMVVQGIKVRRTLLSAKPRAKVIEAVVMAGLCFSVYFWLPFGFTCLPCRPDMDCFLPNCTAYVPGTAYGSGSGSSSGSFGTHPCEAYLQQPSGQASGLNSGTGSTSGSATLHNSTRRQLFGSDSGLAARSSRNGEEPWARWPERWIDRWAAAFDASTEALADAFDASTLGALRPRGRRLAGGSMKLRYVQHHCDHGYFNAMASLLNSGQEGLIKHLLERTSADAVTDPTFDWVVLMTLLVFYFVLAFSIFGIAVPAGNFVPAMTIGCILGRLVGQVLIMHGVVTDTPAGTFALMGAASVLGGVTRMTLTLACLLTEVTNDVPSLLPMMLVLAVAKAVGDILSPSFDHAMMHVQHLPFLDEEPPTEFALFTARDVMARTVVVLKEVERVGDLLAVLKKTGHNGFPIVDVGQHSRCTFFCGLLLRRQLLVLIRERVWDHLNHDLPLPPELRTKFLCSAFARGQNSAKLSDIVLSEEDKDTLLDLRPFMDPSPYVVSELMPLRRVYRLFNEIGVRHLPVVDCREQVVGMITRKDILPEQIELRVTRQDNLAAARRLTSRHSAAQHGPSSVLRAAKRVSAPAVKRASSMSATSIGAFLPGSLASVPDVHTNENSMASCTPTSTAPSSVEMGTPPAAKADAVDQEGALCHSPSDGPPDAGGSFVGRRSTLRRELSRRSCNTVKMVRDASGIFSTHVSPPSQGEGVGEASGSLISRRTSDGSTLSDDVALDLAARFRDERRP